MSLKDSLIARSTTSTMVHSDQSFCCDNFLLDDSPMVSGPLTFTWVVVLFLECVA